MAKSIKSNTKELEKQVRKAYKNKPKLTLLIFLFLFGGAFIYSYIYGYWDEYFKKQPTPQQQNERLFEQDENGFYYYNLSGYEEGQYYSLAKNLRGEELAEKLHIIINDGFRPISYGDARYVLSFSDRDPKTNNESVRGMYDSDTIATTWIGEGEGAWQREHVWPNSKLGVPRVANSTKNQGSDLHNLRAITGINQTRSNRYFDDGTGAAHTVGSDAFYPGDDHKGDVARILFYMDIMYEELTLTNDTTLLADNEETNYLPEGAYSGILDLLIKWHKEDPVDQFELQRNEFIYSGIATDPKGREIQPQGNRNPFIDKPELVHLIWEDKEIEDLLKPEAEPTNVEPIKFTYYFDYSRKNEWYASL